MRKAINIWHYISVYLAGFTALAAIFFPVNTVQKCLLASIIILFLHFFEEFGYPGGFPLMGMKVMMNSDEMDSLLCLSYSTLNNLTYDSKHIFAHAFSIVCYIFVSFHILKRLFLSVYC